MTGDIALNDARMYSQINFAMNSARIIRVLTENREYNLTERQLVTNCESELILCCLKLWDTDSRSYSLKCYVEIHSELTKYEDKENKLEELNLLESKYKKVIDSLRTFRNKQIAHLDPMSWESFMGVSGGLKDIQNMLQEITHYLNSLPWLEGKELLGGFLEYDQIEADLRI